MGSHKCIGGGCYKPKSLENPRHANVFLVFAFVCAVLLPLSCDGAGSVDMGGDIVEAIEKSRTTQITFYDKEPTDPTAKSVNVRYKFEEVVNLNIDYPKNLNFGNVPKGWVYVDLQGTGTPSNISSNGGETIVNITQRDLCFYATGWEHFHTIATEWTSDATHHWHEASCGLEEHMSKAAHTADSTAWENDDDKHWQNCTVCTAVFNKVDHSWGTPLITSASCTNNGTKTYSCTVCSKTKTETITATGHTYETTWTTDGTYHWHTCSECGAEGTKAAHTLTEWQTNDSKHWKKCTVCGATLNEASHTLATAWEKDDTDHWHTCSVCGAVGTKTAHDFGSGTVTTPATCSATGIRTYTCDCGKTKTETIAKTDHPYSTDWSSDGTNHWHAATCLHDVTKDKAAHTANTSEWEKSDTQHWRECSVCHAAITATNAAHTFATTWTNDDDYHWHVCSVCGAAGAKTAHAWGSGTVTTAATCTTDGVKTYTCACGKTKTETIAATGHTFDETTWIYDGTNHWHKATCEHTSEIKDQAAHAWNAGVVTTAATCTTAGEKNYTCTVCSKTKTETIDATGHTFATEWESDGTNHWHVCNNCDEVDTATKAAHTASTWENDDDKHWKECTACNAEFSEAEHTWGWNTGKTKRVCSGCSLEREELLSSEVADYLAAHSGETVSLKVKATNSSDLHNIKTALKANTDVTGVNLEITGDITTIGMGAFQECTSLTSVTIPNTVTSIGNYAFDGCSSLTSVTIPGNVTSIGEYAFNKCTSLPSVTIPNTVTRIGKYAFNKCTSLPSVTIPDGVESISNATFSGCTSLTSVTIPGSVTSIEGSAFSGCTSLSSVTIPSSVTSIGDFAFNGCTSLASVIVEATNPPALGTTIFGNNASGRKICVPSGSVATYKAAAGWSTYAASIEAITTP